MLLPIMQEEQSTRKVLENFKGYNRNVRIGDGEFADMTNMTSDFYPTLSPRGPRGQHDTSAVQEPLPYDGAEAVSVDVTPTALLAKDELCYVSGSHMVIGNTAWDIGLTEGEKQVVSMGGYAVVFPDGKYINAAEFTEDDELAGSIAREAGTLGASYTTTDSVTFEPCNINGEVYENIQSGNSAPAEPENMTLWMDTSGEKKVLKQYSAVTSTWVTIPTTYVKISAIGIANDFSRYDGVKISSAGTAQFQKWLESAGIAGDGNVILWGVNNEGLEAEDLRDSIIVVGLLSEAFEATEPLMVTRSVPKMDYVIECGNRLWGCAYYSGYDRNGVRQVLNEIYASKLGDFKNWNCFMGISTDSYTAVVGTDGPFTGAVAYNGSPIFFKENAMHRVYGTQPSNFQIQTSDCKGVQDGSWKSLAVVNEILYYKARNGIMSYDGSYPIETSYAFGGQRFENAVAGAVGNKYYVRMTDSDTGANSLFVFDTQKGLWHREDDINITDFCEFNGELYGIDGSDHAIVTMLGSGQSREAAVDWAVESGLLYLSYPDAKYMTRLVIRMQMDVGSTAKVFLKYDNETEWTQMCSLVSRNMRSFSVPIRTKRCDTMRYRIEGTGAAKIYTITKTFDQGSDVW